MTAFVILFIVSISFIVLGFRLLRTIYEDINLSLVRSSLKSKNSQLILISICGVGIFLGIIGAVLYYQVCAAAIENVIKPHHPVEEPYQYGIEMLMTSLIFVGGMATSGSVLENEGKTTLKVFLIGSISLLLIYLFLKGLMILP